MKAVLMTQTGPTSVLELQEVEEPQITQPHELKIRVRAAGMNPLDAKLRARGLFYPNALPAILGCDGAGEVVAVGKRVSQFKLGDEVWYCHGGLGKEPGSYAQYHIIPEQYLCLKPKSVDFVTAAAGPLVLISAWESLFLRAYLDPHSLKGQQLLVHGGAGGVGHVALQLAKYYGAHVITTVGSAASEKLVKRLGADHVVRYDQQDFVSQVNALTQGEGVNMVLDTVGGEVFKQSILTLIPYGVLVTLLDPGTDILWKEARNRNLSIIFELMLTPMLKNLVNARRRQVDILRQCATLIDAGKISLHVDSTYPLSQANLAHEQLEHGRGQGKIVLTLDDF